MKNCPTCGQAILPSMGDRVARQVDAAQAKTPGIRPNLAQPAGDNVTLTLHIGNSASSVRAETTPRGYKGQHVQKKGERYRFRVALLSFPRKGTMGGKLTVIPLGPTSQKERKPVVYDLPEQPTTHPAAPYTHEFQVTASLDVPTPVKIVLVVA